MPTDTARLMARAVIRLRKGKLQLHRFYFKILVASYFLINKCATYLQFDDTVNKKLSYFHFRISSSINGLSDLNLSKE